MKSVKLSITHRNIDRDNPFSSVMFALAAPIRTGMKMASNFHSCREGFIGDVANWFNGTPYRKDGKLANIDTKRVRLVVYQKVRSNASKTQQTSFETWMKNALKVINILERKAGWSLSKLYKATTKYTDSHMLYIFVGSPRWMKSPHFLSMYCLLVRMAEASALKNIKTYDGLMTACKKIAKSSVKDTGHVRVTYDKWLMLMKNYKTLFKDRMMKKCFSNSTYKDKYRISGEGITKLCSGQSNDLLLEERFAKLCKKNKIAIRRYNV